MNRRNRLVRPLVTVVPSRVGRGKSTRRANRAAAVCIAAQNCGTGLFSPRKKIYRPVASGRRNSPLRGAETPRLREKQRKKALFFGFFPDLTVMVGGSQNRCLRAALDAMPQNGYESAAGTPVAASAAATAPLAARGLAPENSAAVAAASAYTMARILFTASFGRAADNWVAAFTELHRRGHDVRTLLFPVVSDPDHRRLDRLDFPTLARVPVQERLRDLSVADAGRIAAVAAPAVQQFAPELLVSTACHTGPELALLELLAQFDHRPITAGCQHGFVQRWDSYWRRFAFDHLLVFGDAFRRIAPAELVHRVSVAGLPKLDAFTRSVRPQTALDRRPILFAAQTAFPRELGAALMELGSLTGRQILIRPHPAYPLPAEVAELRLPVAAPAALAEQLRSVSLVVTTGSTIVLEALAAGCPVVALPLQDGDEYTALGVVAAAITATAIAEAAVRQQTGGFQDRIRGFLADTTGAADGGRTVMAADAIQRLVLSRRAGGPQA